MKYLPDQITSAPPPEHWDHWEEFDAKAWAIHGTSSIAALLDNRIVELAIHGWDVRYAIDRATPLSPQVMPFLTDWAERGLSARLRDFAEPATYRFAIENDLTFVG